MPEDYEDALAYLRSQSPAPDEPSATAAVRSLVEAFGPEWSPATVIMQEWSDAEGELVRLTLGDLREVVSLAEAYESVST